MNSGVSKSRFEKITGFKYEVYFTQNKTEKIVPLNTFFHVKRKNHKESSRTTRAHLQAKPGLVLNLIYSTVF